MDKPKTLEEKKEQFYEGLRKIIEAKERLGLTKDVTYKKSKEMLDKLTKEQYNKQYAQIVERRNIGFLDVGAVPTASTIYGGDSGSTGFSKVVRRPKANRGVNDNFAPISIAA